MKLKLGRVLKIVSTLLIAVGIAYLFLFVREQHSSITDVLDRPSYYVTQNFQLLFLAGIAAVAFSVLGSFFSWSDKIDPPEQVLVNAGYTSAKDIDTWLKGSTADENTHPTRNTFSEPFVPPSTVVMDFETSEEIKKASEITGPVPVSETGMMSPAAETGIMEPAPETELMSPAPETEMLEETLAEEPAPVEPEAEVVEIDEEPAPDEPEVKAVEPEIEAPESEPEAEVVEPEVKPEPDPIEPEAAAAAPVPETELVEEEFEEDFEDDGTAITETLEFDEDDDDEEAAITETLEFDDDDDDETAITETLETDSSEKEADA